jgi:XTP/dITP diphosphohydrolase
MRSDAERSILLATRSNDKVREVRAIVPDPLRKRIVSLVDIGLDASADEDSLEIHDTFAGNALAKANWFSSRTGLTTIADDSGLVVHALPGRPGVHSKRFSGRTDLSGTALDEANNRALLDALSEVNSTARAAHYVCVAALVRVNAAPVLAVGTASGSILTSPAGCGGFGYDPLFLPHGLRQSFGEIDPSEKHALSHRGRAFRALALILASG